MKKSKRKAVELISKTNLNIKLRREQLGLNQAELDKITGLRTYKYESGEQEMTLTTIAIFSQALQLKPHELLMDDGLSKQMNENLGFTNFNSEQTTPTIKGENNIDESLKQKGQNNI